MSTLEETFRETNISLEELEFIVKTVEYSKTLRSFRDKIDGEKYVGFTWDCTNICNKLHKILGDVITQDFQQK